MAFGGTMTLFRAVAWDIDGTLIDSEPLHQRALLAASAALGADLNDLENDAFRGVHAHDIWKALRPRFSADATFEIWIREIESYYVAHAAELEPIPGAIDAMRELAARGVAQACVSNSGRTIVDANIKTLGIGKIIAFSLSLDDVVVGQARSRAFPRGGAAAGRGAAGDGRRRGQWSGRPFGARRRVVRGRLRPLGRDLRRR